MTSAFFTRLREWNSFASDRLEQPITAPPKTTATAHASSTWPVRGQVLLEILFCAGA